MRIMRGIKFSADLNSTGVTAAPLHDQNAGSGRLPSRRGITKNFTIKENIEYELCMAWKHRGLFALWR